MGQQVLEIESSIKVKSSIVERMARELLLYLSVKGPSTLAAITRDLPDFSGECLFFHCRDKNTILWDNVSIIGSSILAFLKAERLVDSKKTRVGRYLDDGRALFYPIAKRIPPQGYRAPHWLPVVYSLTKKGKEAVC